MSDKTQTKHYWKSLERLAESPALREQFGQEFPQGASLPPDTVSRRSLLKIMAASFGMAGLAACRRPEEVIVPLSFYPEDYQPGQSRFYATTMPLGTSCCGLLVESHEGRPIKVEGNPLHPGSLGGANAWMQAAILSLYDPDRAPGPQRRAEESQAFEKADWNDFLNFWIDERIDIMNSAGGSLAVLSRPYASPTFHRLRKEFQRRFPQSRWVTYEPFGDENIFDGLGSLFGRPYRPVYNLKRADVILSLDSDFLLTESESVVQARDYAEARREAWSRQQMNRLYVVEGPLSLTGAAADHRLALPRTQVGQAVAALAKELQKSGLDSDLGPIPETDLAPEIVDRLRVMARDLHRAKSRAVIFAGRAQPPAVHALAMRLNVLLGAVGSTVALKPLRDASWSDPKALQGLTSDMRQGRVSMLLVLDGNPVYDAPSELRFRDSLASVTHSIHLSEYFNETSAACSWHLPKAHFLESWADARAANESASVVQPLVDPLFGGRTELEVLDLFLRDGERKGYEIVRETWMGSLLGDASESSWEKVLHDGIYAPAEEVPTAPVETARIKPEDWAVASQSGPPSLEVNFVASPAVYDGRYSNNAWLQELPDPITKIVWDNAALLSPRTARRLGIDNGDIVRLACGQAVVEIPVWIVPGIAAETLVAPLGYGRTHAGRVGNQVGFDLYPLRTSKAFFAVSEVTLKKTGRSHAFAQTQEHWSMEGRALLREAAVEDVQADPDVFAAMAPETAPVDLWKPPNAAESPQWGMVIDLDSCIGCNACVVACQSENNIPVVGKDQVARGREMHWLRVDRYFSGHPENPGVAFQPVPCMQCENAPCEQVCPVAATVHDSEGLNVMVYNRCIGTRYCSNNCPYKVRRFNFFNFTKGYSELLQMAMNPEVTVRSRGVMEKCTYCVQRISEAKWRAGQEGQPLRDGELQTACQQTCPTQAIRFGDVADPDSVVSRQKREKRNYVLLEELNNRPRTSYLGRLRNPNPEWRS